MSNPLQLKHSPYGGSTDTNYNLRRFRRKVTPVVNLDGEERVRREGARTGFSFNRTLIWGTMSEVANHLKGEVERRELLNRENASGDPEVNAQYAADSTFCTLGQFLTVARDIQMSD